MFIITNQNIARFLVDIFMKEAVKCNYLLHLLINIFRFGI